jgi:hypothetical protein
VFFILFLVMLLHKAIKKKYKDREIKLIFLKKKTKERREVFVPRKQNIIYYNSIITKLFCSY